MDWIKCDLRRVVLGSRKGWIKRLSENKFYCDKCRNGCRFAKFPKTVLERPPDQQSAADVGRGSSSDSANGGRTIPPAGRQSISGSGQPDQTGSFTATRRSTSSAKSGQSSASQHVVFQHFQPVPNCCRRPSSRIPADVLLQHLRASGSPVLGQFQPAGSHLKRKF